MGLGLRSLILVLLALQSYLSVFAYFGFSFRLLLSLIKNLSIADLGLRILVNRLQRERILLGLPRVAAIIGGIKGRQSRYQRGPKISPGARLQTHLNHPPNPIGRPNSSQDPRDPGQG